VPYHVVSRNVVQVALGSLELTLIQLLTFRVGAFDALEASHLLGGRVFLRLPQSDLGALVGDEATSLAALSVRANSWASNGVNAPSSRFWMWKLRTRGLGKPRRLAPLGDCWPVKYYRSPDGHEHRE